MADKLYAFCVLLIASVFSFASAEAAQLYDSEESPVWQQLKKSVFEARPVNATFNNTIRLDIASRADDASIVPVVLRTITPR